MTDAPGHCPDCGVLLPELDHLREIVVEKDAIIHDLERELRAKRSQISRMKGERDQQRVLEPLYEQALEVFDYWRARHSPTAKEFTGERFDKVVARLKKQDVATLKKAIDGAKARPYQGRARTPLETICRSETQLQMFCDFADQAAGEREQARHLIPLSRLATMQAALSPAVLARLAELRGWTAEVCLSLGLGLEANRVVFPIYDADEILTGLCRYQPNRQRRQGPKNIAEGSRDLFPAPETIDAKRVWLVEGEPDCVAMRSMGLPAISVPGVATWKEGWAERFDRFDQIIVCFDCDDEGRKAADIRLRQLSAITRASIIDIDPTRSDGWDLSDMLLERGDECASALIALATETGGVTPLQPRLGESPFDAICRELEQLDCRVRHQHAGKATAQCPVHEDRVPSLSLSEGDDGRVLLHCHAGCTTEEIVAALGFEMKDLFTQRRDYL